MTSTKGDQTMRKPKENVKEISLSKQLIKEKPAYESAMYFSNMRHQSGGPKEPK
jgi:hypothetical protein